MLTPQEILEKKFDKTFGFGYRMDDVEDYLASVASSMTELADINADLEKKLEVLADKLTEYREDEESLRTALLGAQKLGDSVIRESKTKAEIIMRDATIKADTMVSNARSQIEKEQKSLEVLKREVASFKNRLIALYRQHLELLSALPGEVDELTIPGQKEAKHEVKSAPAAPPAPERQPEPVVKQEEPVEEEETELEEPVQEPAPVKRFTFTQPVDEEEPLGEEFEEDDDDDDDEEPAFTGNTSRFSDLKFGDAFRLTREEGGKKKRK